MEVSYPKNAPEQLLTLSNLQLIQLSIVCISMCSEHIFDKILVLNVLFYAF